MKTESKLRIQLAGVTLALAFCVKLLVAIALLALAGCVTKNPDYTPGNTNGIPAFIVDEARINAASNTVVGVSNALKPVNPYSPITDYVINGAFGLTALLSGFWARHKNKVADVIAAGAVKAGPQAVQAILDHASQTNQFGAVSSAINVNTGANQNVTGAAPGT